MTPRPRAAAIAWILGAAAYLAAEAASASAYRPSYSYADDFISDLGVPGQPLAALPTAPPRWVRARGPRSRSARS